MQILVTGGTGVVGRATVTQLLRRGHSVRLLSRHADDDSNAWDGPVTAFPCDVGDPAALHGAADGCDAVVHIAGIIEESPPDATFARVNVLGTRSLLAEAERAGARRFVFVSSLGVQRGESAYHHSKHEGEDLVRAASLDWVIVRMGAVAGPGDETVSALLRMVRTLPVVPMVGDGSQTFQPVWHEDAAFALGECAERADVARTVLNVAGPEMLTVRELFDAFCELTGRAPLVVPLPSVVAQAGASIAGSLGIDTPASVATIQMLLEGNYLRDNEPNDLTGRLGVTTSPIRSHLTTLVDALPEQTPEEGSGRLKRRRFTLDMRSGRYDAAGVMRTLRERFAEIMHVDAAAEPGAPVSIEDGATLTLELPGRGHVQVRVQKVDQRSFTLATLEGHPLAGIVRFRTEDRSDGVRLTIDVAERPASRIDRIAMALGGSALQSHTWKRTANNLADAVAAHERSNVEEESWTLDDDDAEPLEEWVRAIVQERQKRAEHRT